MTDGSGRPLSVAIITPTGRGELRDHLQTALDQISAYDEARAQAAKLHYDPVGVEQHVAPVRQKAQRATETVTTWARHAVKVAAERRAEIYAPPPLDPADAAGAQRGAEIRASLRTMSRKERDEEYGRMARGENEAGLLAVMRDPMPTRAQRESFFEAVWRPRIERERAEDIAKVEAEEQEAMEALESAQSIQRALDKNFAGLALPPLATQDVTYGATVGTE